MPVRQLSLSRSRGHIFATHTARSVPCVGIHSNPVVPQRFPFHGPGLVSRMLDRLPATSEACPSETCSQRLKKFKIKYMRLPQSSVRRLSTRVLSIIFVILL